MKTNETQVLDQFLDFQDEQDSEMLFALYRDSENENKIRLLLWIERTESFSDFFIEIPGDVIETVEPTTATGFYGGKKMILAKINFNQEKLNNFLSPEELFLQIRENQLILDTRLSSVDGSGDDISINGTTGSGLGNHTKKNLFERPMV